MSLLLGNFRSILPKQDDLIAALITCSTDIIIGTETWLSDDTPDSHLSFHPEYNIFRKDRKTSRGGGVLIAVRKSFHSVHVPVPPSSIETCWALVRSAASQSSCVLIGACYRPPNSNTEFLTTLQAELEYIHCSYPRVPTIMAGDFNFPGIDWLNNQVDSSSSIKNECNNFLHLLGTFSLQQMVKEPTRGEAILDIVCTTHPDSITVNVLDEISDHKLVQFNFDFISTFSKNSRQHKFIFDYSKANMSAINEFLNESLARDEHNFRSRTVEQNWIIFKEALLYVRNHFVPKLRIYPSIQSPWFTRNVKRIIGKKKRAFKAAQRSNHSDAWQKYKQASRICKVEIKKAKAGFFNKTLPTLLKDNPKQFWNTINPNKRNDSKNHASTNRPSLLEIAESHNTAFSSVFTTESSLPPPHVTSHPECAVMPDILITLEGVVRAIQRLPNRCSPGPDQISSKLLKLTVTQSSSFLCKLFQQSIDENLLPGDWKLAFVVPIFKAGDHTDFSNYRPISLTSIPCKILEHILYTQIMQHLSSNNLLFPNQHGFQRGKSCESQLFEFITDLHTSIHSGNQTDAVFVDFSKAFDLVPHQRLVSKLHSFYLNNSTILWIQNFLLNRSQCVTIHDIVSSSVPVTSGVPQGSVLGPLLFLMYVNDIPDFISSKIRFYADDCVLYREIKDCNDSILLQNDLNSVSSWCSKWLMRVNTEKTKVMTFTSVRSPLSCDYYISGSNIGRTDHYKYLGVILTSNLSWNAHIDHITNKASKTLGLLRKSLYMATWETKLMAYNSFVRPQLEYAAIIWNPHQMYLKKSLDAVQNRAIRFILRNYTHQSITLLRNNLKLPTLEQRRENFLLQHFFKLYHGASTFRYLHIKPANHISPRTDHPLKVFLPFARTNMYKYSPLVLAIKLWNNLPCNTAVISDYDAFCNALSQL